MANDLRYEQLLQLLSDLDDDDRMIIEAELFQAGYCHPEGQTTEVPDSLGGMDLKVAA